jgi:hypothetical protein
LLWPLTAARSGSSSSPDGGADKGTYQSDSDAVDEPSQNSTHHAEDNDEGVLLLVSKGRPSADTPRPDADANHYRDSITDTVALSALAT